MIDEVFGKPMSRRAMLALGLGAALPVARLKGNPAQQEFGTQSLVERFGPPIRGKILLPGTEISISRPLVALDGNLWVKGVAGKTKISSPSVRGILRLGEISNVVFEDIDFATLYEGGGQWLSGGVVYSNNVSLRGITFVRCRFSAPHTAINGIKLVADHSEIDNINFHDCIIDSVGRMGLEIQAHSGDQIRYENVVWEGGSVNNTGLHGAGMGISLSGMGRNCKIDANFDNNSIGIENVGCSASVFSGNFSRQRADILSFTGKRAMEGNHLRDIRCQDRAAGHLTLRNQRRLRSTRGKYDLGGYVRLRNVAQSSFTDEIYRTAGPHVLFLEGEKNSGGEQGPSTDNRWERCSFDGQDVRPEFASIRFSGTQVARNVVEANCTIVRRATGGAVLADTQHGRTGNRVLVQSVTRR